MIIREATKADIPEIQNLIQELADVETHTGAIASQEYIEKAFFSDHCPITIYLMEVNQKVIGMAHLLVFPSTFSGQHLAFLQDFVIFTQYRNQGFGRKFIKFLCKVCLDNGYHELTWNYFTWNKPAANFYESLGEITKDISNCTLNKARMKEVLES